MAEADPAVARARTPLTMHFSPRQVLLNLDVQFREGLSATEVTAAVNRLEQNIRKQYPQMKRIFIEAESLREGYSSVTASSESPR